MSAFFTGAGHVTAILTWVEEHSKYSVPYMTGGYSSSKTHEELTEIGRNLLAENIASLRSRYPDDWQDMVDIDVNEYVYKPDHAFLARTTADVLPATIIKLCQCYEYQSCEHSGWKDSYAKRFIDSIEGEAISQLPGYDEAPWIFDAAA